VCGDNHILSNTWKKQKLIKKFMPRKGYKRVSKGPRNWGSKGPLFHSIITKPLIYHQHGYASWRKEKFNKSIQEGYDNRHSESQTIGAFELNKTVRRNKLNMMQQSASPSGKFNQNLKLPAKENENKRKRIMRVLKVRTVDLRERKREQWRKMGKGVCIVPW